MDTDVEKNIRDRENLLKSIAIEFSHYFEKNKEEHKEVGLGEKAKLGQVSALVILGTGGVISHILQPIPFVGTVFNKLGELAYGKWNSEDVKLLSFSITTPSDPQEFKQMILTAGVKFALVYEEGLKKAILSDGNRSAICVDATHRIFSHLLTLLKEKDQHLKLTEKILLQGIIQGQSKQKALSRVTFGISKSGNLAVYMKDGSKLSTAKFLNANAFSSSSIVKSEKDVPFDGEKYQGNLFTRRRFKFEPEANEADKKWWDEQQLLIERIVNTNGDVKFIKDTPKVEKIWFEIKTGTTNFVGRTKQIQDLIGHFESPRFLVTISGMGGVGKSELARQFALALRQRTNHSLNCIWLNGETADSLNNSVIRIAEKYVLKTISNENRSRPTEDIFDDVLMFTSHNIQNADTKRILVIIDNVDKANKGVQAIFTETFKTHSFTVVTSRSLRVLGIVGDEIKLDIFEDEDAQKLVQSSIADESTEDVKNLCRLTGNFPLALQQAIAYIKKEKEEGPIGNSYKIQNYIREFETGTEKAKLLNFPLNLIEHDYKETTFITWNISIEKIKNSVEAGKVALELLDIMAYFEPDGIHVDWMYRLCGRKYTKDAIDEAVRLIKGYSLVKVEDNVISIHRLVQQVIGVKNFTSFYNNKTGENELGSSKEMDFLRNLITDFIKVNSTWELGDIQHIIAVWKYAIKYDKIVQEFSTFPQTICNKLYNFSRYREMVELAILSSDRLTEVCSELDLDALRFESQVCHYKIIYGEYDRWTILQKIEKVYAKLKEHLGEKHEITVDTAYKTAFVLSHLYLDKSLELYWKVLESQKRIYGEDSPQVIRTKHDIGNVLRQMGKHEEAAKIYQEVLEFQTTTYGPHHPDTLVTRHNMAVSLFEQRDFEKACEEFDQVLALQLQVHGEEHPEILTTKCMLGLTWAQLNQNEEALEILNQVFVLQCKFIGPGHPRTKETRHAIDTIEQRDI